ncbi:MAG: pimeloyl-ACP methyl ester carboxylesterase [Glaciecola sp.]|jgi:pimeloyl-ACP methyl ester carboxylesterase
MHRIIYLYLVFIVSVVNLTFGQQGIISSEIVIQNDSITLPGTLIYNTTIAEQTLVIFVHGSGNVDRNGNQASMGANPNYIKQLSDSLTLKNITFYRFLKRSATASNIKFMMKDMRFDAFAEDLNLIIDKFKEDKRFSSITLIGHSQGSLIAMLANQTHIDKYISLAGPSQSIDHSIIAQVKLQNGDSIANIVKSHFVELSETGGIENIDKNLMAMFNKPTQPLLSSWIKFNPSEEIKKIKIPILILNGDTDLQVYIDDVELLHSANPKSKLVIIKNMNHVLKTIIKDSDNLPSYRTSSFALSKELVSTIEAFVKK